MTKYAVQSCDDYTYFSKCNALLSNVQSEYSV